jgi:hypothetical protein
MASAATHLELRDDPINGWRTVRIAGVRYVRMVSGNSGKVYLVRADARGCECCWYTKTLTACSHMVALDLAALEADITESAEQAPVPLMTYRDLFPGCIAGCGELVERQNERCYRCQSNEVYRLDQQRKRVAVGG